MRIPFSTTVIALVACFSIINATPLVQQSQVHKRDVSSSGRLIRRGKHTHVSDSSDQDSEDAPPKPKQRMVAAAALIPPPSNPKTDTSPNEPGQIRWIAQAVVVDLPTKALPGPLELK